MAFKSNLEEIPKIVQYSHEHWLSYENEIRYTLNFEHITDNFRTEHYLLKSRLVCPHGKTGEAPLVLICNITHGQSRPINADV